MTVGGLCHAAERPVRWVVDTVAHRLHAMDGRRFSPAPTAHEPLPGGESRDLDVLVGAAEGEGFPKDVAAHVVHTYGSEAAAVIRLAQSDPHLAEPVVPGHPTLWAEILHAIRREMAITLCDLLVRRTHLFYAAPDQVLELAPAIAAFAAEHMQWDAERREAELAAYREEVRRSIGFRDGIPETVD